jgi:glucan biosynthesis protein C
MTSLTTPMSSAAPEPLNTTRLYFIDKLRVAITILVIAHHAAQPYGPTGGAWPVANEGGIALLGPFFTVNAAFFMGLFFLLSGYFVPGSYDRKGVVGFLQSRLVRLGIPVLGFALFVFGPISYFGLDNRLSLTEFVQYLYSTGWQALYGHLWFLLHLLLYSCIYILWRKFGTANISIPDAVTKLPAHAHVLIFILALTVVTWIVRIWYPIDRWAAFLFLIPSEVAHLPQYFSLFVVGILAYRYDCFRKMPTRVGLIWLWIGITTAGAYYAYRLVGQPLLPRITSTGGFNWKSLTWCLWEASICAGFCIGLPVLFREFLNKRPSKLGNIIILAAYGAYIIHLLVVVGVQIGIQSISLPPFFKFIIVSIVGSMLSFGICSVIRCIPGATKIL